MAKERRRWWTVWGRGKARSHRKKRECQAGSRVRVYGDRRQKDLAFDIVLPNWVERFALSAETFAQPGNLLSHEALSLSFGLELLHRQFAILRLQADDKSTNGDGIAMGAP